MKRLCEPQNKLLGDLLSRHPKMSVEISATPRREPTLALPTRPRPIRTINRLPEVPYTPKRREATPEVPAAPRAIRTVRILDLSPDYPFGESSQEGSETSQRSQAGFSAEHSDFTSQFNPGSTC